MTTIGVTETPGIRDHLAARKPGAVFADAPVPASNDPADRGQLLLLTSGPTAAADTVGPVFDIIGRKTV
jgi:3-hydroxyisobutyrate dehydrogenase